MGAVFKVPGYILFVIGGIWGLIICLGIIHSKLGFFGVLVSLFLFPVVTVVAPWYVGLADGNWRPLMVIYGSGLLAWALIMIGFLVDKRRG